MQRSFFRFALQLAQEKKLARIIPLANLLASPNFTAKHRRDRLAGESRRESEMNHVMALPIVQMILMPIAWFDHQHLSIHESQLLFIEFTAIGTAVDQDHFIIRMLMARVFVVPFHC